MKKEKAQCDAIENNLSAIENKCNSKKIGILANNFLKFWHLKQVISRGFDIFNNNKFPSNLQ
jgi:hypothetical protein